MQDKDAVNTPLLAGWAIAAGAGTVAFGVSFLLAGIEVNGSVMIGIVILTVVGLVLGLPLKPLAPPNSVRLVTPPVPGARPAAAPSGHAPAPAPAPAAAPASPAPAAAPAAAAPAAAAVAAAPDAPAALADTAPVATELAKPATLAAARDGQPDDLKLIKGIGPKMETMLHGMGFFHYDQIAAWTASELAWVDDNLDGFKGRASRDEWVAQARVLAAGGAPDPAARDD